MRELNKKKVAMVIIAVLVIIAIITIVIILSSTSNNKNNKDALNISEFSNMQAKDLNIKYDEETNQTYVTLNIKNPKDYNVENETVNVMLLNEKDEHIAGVQTYIEIITPNDEFSMNITLIGNITGIKKVSLEKPE